MEIDYEKLILAHRYLYYVKCAPVISDYEYDLLEQDAQKVIPRLAILDQVSSSNPWDYSEEVKQYAESLGC